MTSVVADTSTWARRTQPVVAEALSEAVARNALVMVPTVRLELLWSARSAADLIAESRWYDALRQVELTREIGRRAVAVQAALAARDMIADRRRATS
jgi:predicted nucleic acid-binding protein